MDGTLGLSKDVLDRTPTEVIELLLEQAKRIQKLEAEIEQLKVENGKLRETLGKNSSNSSMPPSSDGPRFHVKRKPPTKPSGRKRGGQKGHKRNVRPLVEPDRVAETIPCKPEQCGKCGETLATAPDDPEPRRKQVAEIPPIQPHVTEYRIHSINCQCCGATTRGTLPPGVPDGSFGPRLCALVVLLTSVRLGKRPIKQLLADLFSLDISLGMISKIERQTSRLLKTPYKALWRIIREANANIDETSWRQGQKKFWLWLAASRWAVIFKIAKRRNAKVAKRILGCHYAKVATSDRHGAYNWIIFRQLCWAHLMRDFQAMIDRDDEGQAIGKLLLAHAVVMFGWWHKVRDGTWSRSTFQRRLRDFQTIFKADLREGVELGSTKTARVCAKLLKSWDHLWTFSHVEGVEPTNNTGEREIKRAVLYRKTSGGTDSRLGSRFVERLFSIVASCRLQERNAFDYLTAVWTAAISGEPIPCLEPPDQHAETPKAA